jgi:hypothetical protein
MTSHWTDEPLRAELLALAEADQAFRRMPLQSLTQAVAREGIALEHAHSARIAEIIAASGWPGLSQVGEDGSSAAWLLVQHADHDVELQERALMLLEQAVAAGQASARNFAYLTDRVCVNLDRRQVYGTQFHGGGASFGPCPITDAVRLDKRRASMGLEPFAEYERSLRAREAERPLDM